MKVYVASSWRNPRYEAVVAAIREAGHDVHDWRGSEYAFSWSEISPEWRNWTAREFQLALGKPRAINAFHDDRRGILTSDVCILLLPCGRSAHLEAGFAAGLGKPLIILLDPQDVRLEPELMYRFAGTRIYTACHEVVTALGRMAREQASKRRTKS